MDRREKMSGFFLNMSNTMLGTFFIGIMLLLTGYDHSSLEWEFIVTALMVTVVLSAIFAITGYRLSSKK